MADKLTTALYLGGARAAWTSLRDRKGSVEIATQVDAPLELAGDAADGGPEAAAQVKAKCSGVKGIVTLVLPTRSTLLRVVELPSTDPEEIRGMAELQIDKFAPFPSDQMCIGHEVLARNGEKSRVLVAGAPRSAVDTIGGLFFQAGILPQAVDVEIMGWWWLLRSKGRIPPAGRHVLLVVSENSSDLVVVQDGSPLLIRSPGPMSADPAVAAQDMADEIAYTLTTLETEWGSVPASGIDIWQGTELPAELLQAISAATGLRVTSHSLQELGPLTEGVARRILEGRGATLDMAPAEWKATALSREARKRALVGAVFGLSIWLMAMVGLFVYAQHEQDQQMFARNGLQRLDRKAGEVRELQKQVQSLQRYADRTYSAIECLREVCMLMPPGPELDSFSYEKFNLVSLRGVADADATIFEFFKELQTSRFFPKVEPGQVTSITRANRPRSQFKLVIKLPEEKKPEEEKKKK